MDLNVAAANRTDGPTAFAGPPQLGYLAQTPIMRTHNKRFCSQLSPSGEEEHAGLVQNFQLAVQDAIEKAVPKIIGQLKKSMQDTIMETIDSALEKVDKDVEQAMRNKMKVLEQEMELKMWCETEKLES